jgi:hypothetical protein
MQVPGRSIRLGEAVRHETNLPASRARCCSQYKQVEVSVGNTDLSASTRVRFQPWEDGTIRTPICDLLEIESNT